MYQCGLLKKPSLKKIQSELKANPGLSDVTCSPGTQTTKVQALKKIPKAVSPAVKNQFKTKWDVAVVRDREGILLPEFDGDMLQLFKKLSLLDTWSVEVIQKLNLQQSQLLHLLSICRRNGIQKAVTSLEILTATFIQRSYDGRNLAFNANRSKSVVPAPAQALDVKSSSSVQPKGTPAAKPNGCSTLSLLSKSRKIEAKTPFICDGKMNSHPFRPKQSFTVVGLGFAGPIDADAFYTVSINIRHGLFGGQSLTEGIIKKRIFALKGQTFYFLFDQPITVEPNQWWHSVWYSLKGPSTPSIVGRYLRLTALEAGRTRLDLFFKSEQLSEILFKDCETAPRV